MQREAFLQQYFISDATIEGIGTTRKATLASFGIETAADIERDAIFQVPGFGEKLTTRLICSRQEIEKQFIFNPAIGLPPRELQSWTSSTPPHGNQLKRNFSQKKTPSHVFDKAERDLRSRYEQIRSCLQMLAQAELDTKVFPYGP